MRHEGENKVEKLVLLLRWELTTANDGELVGLKATWEGRIITKWSMLDAFI